MIKVAISGFGRIGRNVLRACYENGFRDDIEIVAINDLGDAAINAHLLKYDTTHGEFKANVKTQDNCIVVNGDVIHTYSERDPSKLTWGKHDVDVVLECTGIFTDRDKAAMHIESGAKKVVISAPGKNVDKTIVHGVNNSELTKEDTIISNASCTTNCLAPLASALHNELGIETGLVTTVHAYTNDQSLLDVYHPDVRRARAAAHSLIPSKTGAAAAIGLVIPELNGRLDGMAIRVPVINVSLLDLSFVPNKTADVQTVNAIIKEAANQPGSIMTVNELPLVSSDFNHNPASSIVDITQTKVLGNLIKVFAWYDNEWGFSNRMLDNVKNLMRH